MDGEGDRRPLHAHFAQHLGMNLAECRQPVRAKLDIAGPARMPPAVQLAVDLEFRRRTDRLQHRLGIGLGIIKIDRTPRAVRIARRNRADQQPGQAQRLFARLAAREDRTAFEQRQIGEAARLIARRRRQKAGQQVGPQMRHFGTDRVFHPHRIRATAE